MFLAHVGITTTASMFPISFLTRNVRWTSKYKIQSICQYGWLEIQRLQDSIITNNSFMNEMKLSFFTFVLSILPGVDAGPTKAVSTKKPILARPTMRPRVAVPIKGDVTYRSCTSSNNVCFIDTLRWSMESFPPSLIEAFFTLLVQGSCSERFSMGLCKFNFTMYDDST